MTLKEIAKRANVSTATISLVLNDKKGVSPGKRVEIQNLLKELNYQNNRNLQIKKQNLLFIKYSKSGKYIEENEGFIAVIIDALGTECRKMHYQLVFQIAKNSLKDIIANIDYESIDGVFLLGTELEKSDYPLIKRIKKPCIVIDNSIPNLPCNSITMNNQEMMHLAYQHYASQNAKFELGYLHGKVFAQNFEDRYLGLQEDARENNVTIQTENIFILDPTIQGSYTDMMNFLKAERKIPKFLIADNDTIAIGAMQALNEWGIKIPENIQIIGFDDIVFSENTSPSLTTLRVKRRLIGSLAVQILHSSINSPELQNVKIKVGGNLILRESTFNK